MRDRSLQIQIQNDRNFAQRWVLGVSRRQYGFGGFGGRILGYDRDSA